MSLKKLGTFSMTAVNIRATSAGGFGCTGRCKSLQEAVKSFLQRAYDQSRGGINLPTSADRNPAGSAFSVVLESGGVTATS